MRNLTRTLALAAAFAGLSAGAAATAQDMKKKADDKKPAATKPADDKKAPGKTGFATFEVYEQKNKDKEKAVKYRFRLLDAEGKQLAMSHIGYASKEDAGKAIAEIKKAAADAKVVDVKD